MTTTPLAALRAKSEKSEKRAAEDKAALLAAAVAEAITSTRFGHLSAVARESGITSQYLRTLVEAEHPGWLDRAAAQREADKAKAQKAGAKRAA
ncbi:hypothetical protein [Streptomyces sp. NBC_01237]|uniref:hypothetical protein n=1 Tax=Streptomyces sp. NBC_01237 TaxID=2903790 RepID=UPI002DD83A06|nr:hypothetical protein [Streptomyces sp. NBC_01237]WRZ78738.1 hypothetical protein OG251_44745 [Streptomyces sp. NBC_01237]